MPYPPKGIIPPLTTPLIAAGRVYEKGLRQLVDFQIDKGSHGLFVCGTYGSGPLMKIEERMEVRKSCLASSAVCWVEAVPTWAITVIRPPTWSRTISEPPSSP